MLAGRTAHWLAWSHSTCCTVRRGLVLLVLRPHQITRTAWKQAARKHEALHTTQAALDISNAGAGMASTSNNAGSETEKRLRCIQQLVLLRCHTTCSSSHNVNNNSAGGNGCFDNFAVRRFLGASCEVQQAVVEDVTQDQSPIRKGPSPYLMDRIKRAEQRSRNAAFSPPPLKRANLEPGVEPITPTLLRHAHSAPPGVVIPNNAPTVICSPQQPRPPRQSLPAMHIADVCDHTGPVTVMAVGMQTPPPSSQRRLSFGNIASSSTPRHSLSKPPLVNLMHHEAYRRLDFTTRFLLQWQAGTRPAEVDSLLRNPQALGLLQGLQCARTSWLSNVHNLEALLDLPCRPNQHTDSSVATHSVGLLSEGACIFSVCVSPVGECSLQPIRRDKARNAIQGNFGDDRVLHVKFDSIPRKMTHREQQIKELYERLAREGIPIAGRLYKFFAYKDAEKHKDEKCVFVATESHAEHDMEEQEFWPINVGAGLRLFADFGAAPSRAKAACRLALMLSPAIPIPLEGVSIIDIDDVYAASDMGGLSLMTDGCGVMAMDVLDKLPARIASGRMVDPIVNSRAPDDTAHARSCMAQVRLFSEGNLYKGVLVAVHPGTHIMSGQQYVIVKPGCLYLRRDSMKKITARPGFPKHCALSSMEIVSTAPVPFRGHLNKQLIPVLSAAGIPDDLILKLACESIKEVADMLKHTDLTGKMAERLYRESQFQDRWAQVVVRMLWAHFPTTEPFLRQKLAELQKQELEKLQKGGIAISESCMLMGAADPTGTLEEGCVMIVGHRVLEDLQHSSMRHPRDGEHVIMYRAPGTHPGDVRKVRLQHSEVLADALGDGRFGVFFSVKGSRALADMMSGGDYDGDTFWICWRREFVEGLQECPPYDPRTFTDPAAAQEALNNINRVNISPATPVACDHSLTPDEFAVELFKQYLTLRFQTMSQLALAAVSWQCQADLTGCDSYECRQLDHYYRLALDASKAGKEVKIPPALIERLQIPHYFEGKAESYLSVPNLYWKKCASRSSQPLAKIWDMVDTYLKYGADEPVSYELDEMLQVVGCHSPDLMNYWTEEVRQYYSQAAKIMQLKDAEPDNDAYGFGLFEELYDGIRMKLVKGRNVSRPSDELLREVSAFYTAAMSVAKQNTQKAPKRTSMIWYVAGDMLCNLKGARVDEKQDEEEGSSKVSELAPMTISRAHLKARASSRSARGTASR